MQCSVFWKEINSGTLVEEFVWFTSHCIQIASEISDCFVFPLDIHSCLSGTLRACCIGIGIRWWWGTSWGWFFSWLELNQMKALLSQRYCSYTKWAWKDSQAQRLSAGYLNLLIHCFNVWGAQKLGTVPIGHLSWWQKGNEEVPLPWFLC